MNLSVISRYALRDGRTKIIKDIFSFVVIPLLGFISIFAMWLEIEETALKYGLGGQCLVFYTLVIKPKVLNTLRRNITNLMINSNQVYL